jgi:uncharacterized membrane protein YoaT (DUF817 family)
MADRGTRYIERKLGDWARARLHPGVAEFVMFVLKQGWACLFGGLMLAAIILSKAVWQDDWTLARYDGLLIFAILVQVSFLWAGLENWREAKVILLFHLTGTVMEIFKLRMGSWGYPEPGLFKLMGVPLFSGFMYASVGSYMARVIRIFEMRFAPFPPYWVSVALGAAIYANFFAHHFVSDIRMVLFAGTIILYWRTRIWFFVGDVPRWMPLPAAALLSSFFLWLAENIGTLTGTWVYAGTSEFAMASLSKMGSWYLLLYVSFATVTLVYRDHLSSAPLRPATRHALLGSSPSEKGYTT